MATAQTPSALLSLTACHLHRLLLRLLLQHLLLPLSLLLPLPLLRLLLLVQKALLAYRRLHRTSRRALPHRI